MTALILFGAWALGIAAAYFAIAIPLARLIGKAIKRGRGK